MAHDELEKELIDWLDLAKQVLNKTSMLEINDKLSDLIEQEIFWNNMGNMQRWEYDLINFIDWLKNYKQPNMNEYE